MSTSTSTGTLTAGTTQTFDLAPASAVTLTLLPNVRVTITETPESVSGSGVGGNTTRVHEPRLPGTFTYGPYPMGGTVVVDVESNSGSSVAWVYTSAAYATDSSGNVTGLVGPDGNVTGIPEWPGLGGRFISDVLPRNIPIFVPDILQTQIAAVASPGSGVANSYDTTIKEFGAGSLKISVPGALGSDVTFRVALPANYFGKRHTIGSRIHVRMRCTDWAALTRFYVSPSEQGSTSHRYICTVCESIEADLGQQSMPASWNNTFRTVQLDGYRRVQVGSPAPWLTDTALTAQYEPDGIVFTLRTSAALDIHIDRIYSPEWPVGVYTVVGDGGYDTFQSTVVAAFNQRGWKLGASALKVNDIVGHYPNRGYPTEAQLAAMAAAGHDVFPHYCVPSPLFNHNEEAFTAATTLEQVRNSAASLINRAVREHGASNAAIRYCQFLQNSGKYVGTDMAGVLAEYGVNYGRGPCSDAQWGIDPFHSTVGGGNASYRNQESGDNKTVMAGWIPKRGRFNSGHEQAWFANITGVDEGDRLLRDTYAGSAIELATTRAGRFADGVGAYTHYVEPFGGPDRANTAALEPTQFNSGVNLFRDHLAHLDELVSAGSLVVLSPSQKYALTYGRQGDVYLRWDGEWVNRSDGSIAF